MKTTLTILGDLFPKTINQWPNIPDSDFCVANLECAITNHTEAIKKDGPSLAVLPERIEVLKSLNVDLVGLSNNHILDYGAKGLNDTLDILKKNNINFAGFSPECSSFIKEINNKRIGFYFLCEHQYNYFQEKNIGVNLLELDRNFNDIKEIKLKCDVVFVLFHGGKEHYEYPTPLQQDLCRKFVDSGADVVVCQHSHCVGCEEKYKESTIVYGQGNFIFPYRDNEHFKCGLIIKAVIDENNSVTLEYVPTVHERPEIVEFASANKAEEILNNFYTRSNVLISNSVQDIYNSYVEKNGIDFLYRLLNKGKLYTRIDTSRIFKNRMLKSYIKKNQKYFLYLYNYFNCETHAEYIKAIIYKQTHKEE